MYVICSINKFNNLKKVINSVFVRTHVRNPKITSLWEAACSRGLIVIFLVSDKKIFCIWSHNFVNNNHHDCINFTRNYPRLFLDMTSRKSDPLLQNWLFRDTQNTCFQTENDKKPGSCCGGVVKWSKESDMIWLYWEVPASAAEVSTIIEQSFQNSLADHHTWYTS